MSKFLLSLFTILLLTTFTNAQSKSIEAISEQIKTLKAEKQIQLEYDKSSNYSKLLLISDGFGGEQNRKNNLSSFTFGMMYGFNGRELTMTPEVFVLTFWAKGKNTHFAESHFWKALVDGETVELGEARYARRNGDDREFLNFVVSRDNLEKISNGKVVSFTIGQAEFNVRSESLRMFANLLTISDSTK
jgi:hypothetical protein